MDVVMLHSLHPEHFVAPTACKHFGNALNASTAFYGHGVMSLTHYRAMDTREVRQGLACFCSATCLLLWEHPRMLRPMQ
jgi:hypothetical protein